MSDWAEIPGMELFVAVAPAYTDYAVYHLERYPTEAEARAVIGAEWLSAPGEWVEYVNPTTPLFRGGQFVRAWRVTQLNAFGEFHPHNWKAQGMDPPDAPKQEKLL